MVNLDVNDLREEYGTPEGGERKLQKQADNKTLNRKKNDLERRIERCWALIALLTSGGRIFRAVVGEEVTCQLHLQGSRDRKVVGCRGQQEQSSVLARKQNCYVQKQHANVMY